MGMLGPDEPDWQSVLLAWGVFLALVCGVLCYVQFVSG